MSEASANARCRCVSAPAQCPVHQPNARCRICEAQPGQAVTATPAQAEEHRSHDRSARPNLENGGEVFKAANNGADDAAK